MTISQTATITNVSVITQRSAAPAAASALTVSAAGSKDGDLANISLPAPYSLPVLGLALIGTLVLAVLVVAGPLRRATRLRPGEAIRYS